MESVGYVLPFHDPPSLPICPGYAEYPVLGWAIIKVPKKPDSVRVSLNLHVFGPDRPCSLLWAAIPLQWTAKLQAAAIPDQD